MTDTHLTQLSFDDVEVGHEMTAGPYRLTKEEILDFARRFDPQPFHVDEAAAAKSVFGGLTAAGAHTYAIAQALAGRVTPPLALVAGLGVDEMRLPAPARPGDDLWLTTTLIDKRPSKSRPEQGVARYHTVLRNGAGETVLEYKITILLARREGP
jgi:acyl dehydratase